MTEVLTECGLAGTPELEGLGGALLYLYGDYGAPPHRTPWFVQSLLDDHYQVHTFRMRIMIREVRLY